ncbi:MAG TPA: hypothetical protein VIF09_17600 [Polyangiaceae bacterium]
MKPRPLLEAACRVAVLSALAACGGSGGSSPGAGSPSPTTFDVTTGTGGGSVLPCDRGRSLVQFQPGQLLLSCDQSVTSGADTRSTTLGILQLASYHGSDTYSFTGSADPSAGSVQFTQGGVQFGTQAPGPGFAGTTCKVTVTGPATLAAGSQVSGSFHCDSIYGLSISGDPSTYVPPTVTSADGSFAGSM